MSEFAFGLAERRASSIVIERATNRVPVRWVIVVFSISAAETLLLIDQHTRRRIQRLKYRVRFSNWPRNNPEGRLVPLIRDETFGYHIDAETEFLLVVFQQQRKRG